MIFPKIKISKQVGYYAAIKLTHNFFNLSHTDDLTDILSGAEYWSTDGVPADSAFWAYWNEAIAEVRHRHTANEFLNGSEITDKEGYEAMIFFLEALYESHQTGKSFDPIAAATALSEVLIESDKLQKGHAINADFWEIWLEAVMRVKRGDRPYKQFIA
jgi:hypothetical protein